MRKNYLSLPLLLISVCAAAQDSSRVTTLREVVISASRTEQSLIEVPRSVTVIDQKMLRQSVYQSVGDLLNAQAGLYVVGANQTPGTNQNLFMRGASSNQVAVLVDGVRITDPSTPNAAIDLSEISLANVERIEVIRGSHSTMFGGAAIGGVVNIITRSDAAPGFHGDASWQGGVFGKEAWLSTENINLNYGTRHGLYLNGSFFRQDVQGLDASEKSSTSPSFTSDRDDFQKTDFSVKAGFKNLRWDAGMSFKKAHQYTEIDNGAFLDDDNSYLVFDRGLFQYYGRYKANPFLRFSISGSLSGSERFYENDSSKVSETAYDKSYSTGSYFGQLQTHEVQVDFEKQSITALAGAGLYHETMSFENFFFYNDPSFPFSLETNYDTLDTRTTTRYAFARAGGVFGKFHMSAGTRLSHHSTAGSFLTFEVNPSVVFGDILLYGSLSSGFNAPSLYQLYDPSKGFSAYTTRGNRDLEAEKSMSLEAGVKKEFRAGHYVTVSAYRTIVEDAIEYVYLWNGAQAPEDLSFGDDRGDTYINIGEQVAEGVELEVFARVAPAFDVTGNLTVLKTAMNASPDRVDAVQTGGHHVQLYSLGTFLDGDVEQNHLVRRPDFTALSSLRFRPFKGFTAHVTYRYTGERFDARYDPSLGPYGALARLEVQAYHLLDAGIGWDATDAVHFGLKLENLLNEQYREVAGFQTRGRSAYLRVVARW